jgi:hypothetical protein
MKTAIAIAALTVGVSFAALAADPPGTETARYDYEWIHLRMEPEAGGSPGAFSGILFMGDVTANSFRFPSTSNLQGFIRARTGEVVLDCSVGVGGPGNDDIVQVGPFAQQAQGNTERLFANPLVQTGPGTFCSVPAEIVLDCPFQGVPAPNAQDHHQFTLSGTFFDFPATQSYSQRGQHGPIHCEVFLNGTDIGGALGTLTRIRETRRGIGPAPVPFWQEPHRWVIVPDDVR